MSSIKCAVDCQVSGGPRVAFSEELTVTAYDYFELIIPKATVAATGGGDEGGADEGDEDEGGAEEGGEDTGGATGGTVTPGELVAHIAPAASAGTHPVKLIVIRALGKPAQNEKVSFRSGTVDRSLGRALVLIGSAVDLLTPVPGDITFHNENPDPMRVTVLVGRDA